MAAPPLGLLPLNIWRRRCDAQRLGHILDAIGRYRQSEMQIPPEWYQELAEIIEANIKADDRGKLTNILELC